MAGTIDTPKAKPKAGLLVKRGQFAFFYECERSEIANRVQVASIQHPSLFRPDGEPVSAEFVEMDATTNAVTTAEPVEWAPHLKG